MSQLNRIQYILRKYLKGESNSKELKDAIDFFSNPANDLQVRPELFKWWNRDEESENDLQKLNDADEVLNKIHHRINLEAGNDTKSGIKKIFLNVIKFAAVLLIGLIAGILTNSINPEEPSYYTFTAPEGSISQMLLPDSSIVYLNSGSELKYVTEKNLRTALLSGEAWFDISENKEKPFIVQTSQYDIRVTGTKFNVKAYPADEAFATTLEKGSVQILSLNNIVLEQPETLTPGQQFVFNKTDGSVAVKKVNTKMYTAWKNNELIFIRMKLKELIVLLERKYGVDIEFADNVIPDYHYDGTIKNETILEVLDLLQETLPIGYTIDEQRIVIYKN